MAREKYKVKRSRRPRFSVRTLVIAVTLICAYLACCRLTKNQGGKDVSELVNRRDIKSSIDNVSVAFPFVMGIDVRPYYLGGYEPPCTRQFYFWFFGYVAKLPYQRDVWLWEY